MSFIQSESIFEAIGSGFSAVVLAPVIFFCLSKEKDIVLRVLSKRLAWSATGILWTMDGSPCGILIIGKLMRIDISMLSIYPMFMIATLIGMLTMVPGGMGTFDVLMILGMSQLPVRQDVAVVWLLYYRLFIMFYFYDGTSIVHHIQESNQSILDNIPRLFFQRLRISCS